MPQRRVAALWFACILCTAKALAQSQFVPLEDSPKLEQPDYEQIGGDCDVVSTRLGWWYNLRVTCLDRGTVAARLDESLKFCPPIAGDTVWARPVNEDGSGGLVVTDVKDRIRGAWCDNPVGPVTLTGPCYAEEDPPRGERIEQLGASWSETIVQTQIRDGGDGRVSIGPGGCSPLRLGEGTYRLYIEKRMNEGIWGPCPVGVRPALSGLCKQQSSEQALYEGAVRIDASLAELPAQSAAPFVPGWEDPEAIAAETFAPMEIATLPIEMRGIGFAPMEIDTLPIEMRGVGFEPMEIDTLPIEMRGVGFEPMEIDTLPIEMRGVGFEPMEIETLPIEMRGLNSGSTQ